MTKNLDIITRALKKLSVVPGGGVPDADQASDCMVTMSSMIAEMVEGGLFGTLFDVIVNVDTTALPWSRIRVDTAGVTITLPLIITNAVVNDYPYSPWAAFNDYAGPDYGAWFSCLPRPPDNLSPIVVRQFDGSLTVSIYSAYTGIWTSINKQALQGVFPFPEGWEDGFACVLAERVADEYGAQIGSGTLKGCNAFNAMISNRYDSVRREGRAEYM